LDPSFPDYYRRVAGSSEAIQRQFAIGDFAWVGPRIAPGKPVFITVTYTDGQVQKLAYQLQFENAPPEPLQMCDVEQARDAEATCLQASGPLGIGSRGLRWCYVDGFLTEELWQCNV
jgi:hypothetical protein